MTDLETHTQELSTKTVAELLAYLEQPMVAPHAGKYTKKTKKAELVAIAAEATVKAGESNQGSEQAADHINDVREQQIGVYALEEETKPEPTKVVPNRAALRKAGFRTPKPKVTVTGKVMGLHHKGRALGLKHYRAMGLALGRTCPPEWTNRRQAAPLPNSERVQNYVRGNPLVYPKLTHNQWRRVRRNINSANILSDVYPFPVRREVPTGYSKLAVTPDGRFNLLMQFSR